MIKIMKVTILILIIIIVSSGCSNSKVSNNVDEQTILPSKEIGENSHKGNNTIDEQTTLPSNNNTQPEITPQLLETHEHVTECDEEVKVSGYRMIVVGDNLFIHNDDELLMINKDGVVQELDNNTTPSGISYDSGWVYYIKSEGSIWRVDDKGETKEQVLNIEYLTEKYYVPNVFTVEDRYIITFVSDKEKPILGINIYNSDLDTSLKIDPGDAGSRLVYWDGKMYVYCNNNGWEDLDMPDSETKYNENVIYSIDPKTGIKQEVIKEKWLSNDFCIINNSLYYHTFNEIENQNIFNKLNFSSEKEETIVISENAFILETHNNYIIYRTNNELWLYDTINEDSIKLSESEDYLHDIFSDGTNIYVLFHGSWNALTHQEYVCKYSFNNDKIVEQIILEIEVDNYAYPMD